MKQKSLWRTAAGLAFAGALAACGGGGHDGGKVDPEPQPARAAAPWNAAGLAAIGAAIPGPPRAPAPALPARPVAPDWRA